MPHADFPIPQILPVRAAPRQRAHLHPALLRKQRLAIARAILADNKILILVMKDGDIIEQGNHEELLAANGFYANLYNSQFEDVVA